MYIHMCTCTYRYRYRYRYVYDAVVAHVYEPRHLSASVFCPPAHLDVARYNFLKDGCIINFIRTSIHHEYDSPIGNWSHSVRKEANGANALGRNLIHDEYSPR